MEFKTKDDDVEGVLKSSDVDSKLVDHFMSIIGIDPQVTEAELCETYGYELAMSPAETVVPDEEPTWGSEDSRESHFSALEMASEMDEFDLLEPFLRMGKRQVSELQSSWFSDDDLCDSETADGIKCTEQFDLLETCLFNSENKSKPLHHKSKTHDQRHCNEPQNNDSSRHGPDCKLVSTSGQRRIPSISSENRHDSINLASDLNQADHQASSKKSFAETTILVQGLVRRMTLGQKMKFYAWFNSGLSIEEAAVKSKIPDLIPPPVRHRNCNLSKERLTRLSKLLPNVFLQRQFVYDTYVAGLNPKQIMRYLLTNLGLEELMSEFEQLLTKEEHARQEKLLRRKRRAEAAASAAAASITDEPSIREEDHQTVQRHNTGFKSKIAELKKFYYWRKQGIPFRQAVSKAKMHGREPEIVPHPDCEHSWEKLLHLAQALPNKISREMFLTKVYFDGKDPCEILKTILSSEHDNRSSGSNHVAESEQLLLEKDTNVRSVKTLDKVSFSSSIQSERTNPANPADATVSNRTLFGPSDDQLQRPNKTKPSSFRANSSQNDTEPPEKAYELRSNETDPKSGLIPVVVISSDGEKEEMPKMSLYQLKRYYKWRNQRLGHSEALAKAMIPGLVPDVHLPHPSCKYSWEEVKSLSNVVPHNHYRHKFRVEVYYGGKKPDVVMKNILPNIDMPSSAANSKFSWSLHGQNSAEADRSVVRREEDKAKISEICSNQLKQYHNLGLSCSKASKVESIAKLIPEADDAVTIRDNGVGSVVEISSDDENVEAPNMSLDERKKYYKWRNQGYSHSDALSKAIVAGLVPEVLLPHTSCKYSWEEVKTMSSVVPDKYCRKKFQIEEYYGGKTPDAAMKDVLPNIDSGGSSPKSNSSQSASGQNEEADQGSVSRPAEKTKLSKISLDQLMKYHNLGKRCCEAFEKAKKSGLIRETDETDEKSRTQEILSDDETAEIPKMSFDERKKYYKWRNQGYSHSEALAKAIKPGLVPDVHLPHPSCKYFWEEVNSMSSVLPQYHDRNKFLVEVYYGGKKPEDVMKDILSNIDSGGSSSNHFHQSTGQNAEDCLAIQEDLTDDEKAKLSIISLNQLKKYYKWRNLGLSYREAFDKAKIAGLIPETEDPHPGCKYSWEEITELSSPLPTRTAKCRFQIETFYGGKDPLELMKHMLPDVSINTVDSEPNVQTSSKIDFKSTNPEETDDITRSQVNTILTLGNRPLKTYYAWRNKGLSHGDAISKCKSKIHLSEEESKEFYSPHPNVKHSRRMLEKMSLELHEKFLRNRFLIHTWNGGVDPNDALSLVKPCLPLGDVKLSSGGRKRRRMKRINYLVAKGYTREQALLAMMNPSKELMDELEEAVQAGYNEKQVAKSNSSFNSGDREMSESSGSNVRWEAPQEIMENPWFSSSKTYSKPLSAPIAQSLSCPDPVSQLRFQANPVGTIAANPPTMANLSGHPLPVPRPPSEQQSLPLSMTVNAEPHKDNDLQCFIVPENYPDECFTDSQMNAIEDNILEAILEMDDDVTKPSFKESSRRNGLYRVICNDEFSVEWLYKYLAKYQPWEGALLRLITNRSPKVKAILKLPVCKNDDDEKILKYIEKQNRGMNIGKWTVLRRMDFDEGNTFMDLLIDEESAGFLQKCSKISFKLGSAEIMVAENDNPHLSGQYNSSEFVAASPKEKLTPVAPPPLPPSPPPASPPPASPPPPTPPPSPKKPEVIDTSLGALLKMSAANKSTGRDFSQKLQDSCATYPITSSLDISRKRRSCRNRSYSGERKRTRSSSKEIFDRLPGRIRKRRRPKKDRRRSASRSISHEISDIKKLRKIYNKDPKRHIDEDSDGKKHSWLDWFYPGEGRRSDSMLNKPTPDPTRSSTPLSSVSSEENFSDTRSTSSQSRYERAGSIENTEYEPYIGKSG